MPGHEIIVVGSSAGGIEALAELVRDLPADLPAAVVVVQHLSPRHPSLLPEILARRGPLPASHATDGEPIRAGRIVVAPPDFHLIVRPGRFELSRGPRENRTRPAIDPTFRSAARSYGARVIGIVLSGTLDDGTAGLMAIAARGGMTIAQDPDEALHAEMPLSAIRHVGPRRVLTVGEMPPLLVRLTSEPTGSGGEAMTIPFEHAPESIDRDLQEQAADQKRDDRTIYSCPECGGALWQFRDGTITQFRCHVGHAYSPESFLGELSDGLEAALWRCVRMLTEKTTISRQLASAARDRGEESTAERHEDQAALDESHMRLIRDSLLEIMPGDRSEAIADRQVAADRADSPSLGGEGAAGTPLGPRH